MPLPDRSELNFATAEMCDTKLYHCATPLHAALPRLIGTMLNRAIAFHNFTMFNLCIGQPSVETLSLASAAHNVAMPRFAMHRLSVAEALLYNTFALKY